MGKTKRASGVTDESVRDRRNNGRKDALLVSIKAAKAREFDAELGVNGKTRVLLSSVDMRKHQIRTGQIVKIELNPEDKSFELDSAVTLFAQAWPTKQLSSGQGRLSRDWASTLLFVSELGCAFDTNLTNYRKDSTCSSPARPQKYQSPPSVPDSPSGTTRYSFSSPASSLYTSHPVVCSGKIEKLCPLSVVDASALSLRLFRPSKSSVNEKSVGGSGEDQKRPLPRQMWAEHEQQLRSLVNGALVCVGSILISSQRGKKYKWLVSDASANYHSGRSTIVPNQAEGNGTTLLSGMGSSGVPSIVYAVSYSTALNVSEGSLAAKSARKDILTSEDRSLITEFSPVPGDRDSVAQNLEEELNKTTSPPEATKSYEEIGGLKHQIASVRQLVELPLRAPSLFQDLGLAPPKGVLLFGPPGTGKTMIARAVAAHTGAQVFILNGAEVTSKLVGESEARLRSVFSAARASPPALIFIDEIDVLCPSREDRSVGEIERRLVATLLTHLDGVGEADGVVILAATNRPNALDPALRRPGRLDKEVEIGVPSESDRVEILRVVLQKMPHALTEHDMLEMAQKTRGFVGADIAALCKEAGVHALARLKGSLEARVHPVCVTMADVLAAKRKVKPSALREVSVDVPRVLWSDIGGQEDIKQQLKEAVEWPLVHPEAFERMGIRAPRGVLLYGPPGCSKTLMAKALATEGGMNFLAVKGPELYSKWVGESEKAVQAVFRRARAAAPSVVFFDEIDALAGQRSEGSGSGSGVSDRVLSQLLNELDGVQPLKRVVVVAATNRPDKIDPALLRPGRIDRVLYVPPPNAQARRQIFLLQIATPDTPGKGMPVHASIEIDYLIDRSEGYSGAEIVAICREAAVSAISENANALFVEQRHFDDAFETVQPQITEQMLRFYRGYQSGNYKS